MRARHKAGAARPEDIERLLEIRIKRISRFDIERQRKEIKEIKSSIKAVEKKLKDSYSWKSRYESEKITVEAFHRIVDYCKKNRPETTDAYKGFSQEMKDAADNFYRIWNSVSAARR